MALEAKRLSYRIVEVTAGRGQLNLFRLSGQRKVPVLVDGDLVLSDSTEIINYLDRRSLERRLIPDNLKHAVQVHLIEDWADTTLANSVRSVFLQTLSFDKKLRMAFLPNELPESIRQSLSGFPCELLGGAVELLGKGDRVALLTSLEKISRLLEVQKWLVGDSMTIADLAVASHVSLLRFPPSVGKDLEGLGCPGFSENPALEALFLWRDEIEEMLFQSDPAEI